MITKYLTGDSFVKLCFVFAKLYLLFPNFRIEKEIIFFIWDRITNFEYNQMKKR